MLFPMRKTLSYLFTAAAFLSSLRADDVIVKVGGLPGSQALEDAACLVFLENEIGAFATQHADYPRTVNSGYMPLHSSTWIHRMRFSPPPKSSSSTIGSIPRAAKSRLNRRRSDQRIFRQSAEKMISLRKCAPRIVK
jgi:hypothetical protein